MNSPLRVERPDIANPIIDKFGGIGPMAKLTGHPRHRVEGWSKIGYIGEEYRPWLLAVAKKNGIPHTALDYVEHLIANPIAA